MPILRTLLNQLVNLKKHEALVYCPPVIRSKVVINPDVKPKVAIERVRLNLELCGPTLYHDLSISNPYPFEIYVTTATHLSILEADIFYTIENASTGAQNNRDTAI